jgi:signal transduction histidine kinase
VPIVISGQKLGTVVAGVSLGPYAETQKTALIGSLILGGVLLTAVALAARWLLAAALRPVARMTSDADRWSERDLDRRFALGEPHDELTTLAATLDRLLDRLAASLRHEQRFTAELSHELRTPLAKITAESELALRRARSNDEYRTALDVIKRSADQMARTVDTLVAAARQETGLSRSTADAGAAAAAAHQACAKLAEEQRITLELDAPQAQFRVGVDGDLVERILQPLIENACRYASTRAHTTVSRNNTGVLLTVEDDGPGLSTDELERIFEPGVRGTASEKSRGAAGAGLGLALSRRLARAAGGDVEARPGTTGGCFVVWLPAA